MIDAGRYRTLYQCMARFLLRRVVGMWFALPIETKVWTVADMNLDMGGFPRSNVHLFWSEFSTAKIPLKVLLHDCAIWQG